MQIRCAPLMHTLGTEALMGRFRPESELQSFQGSQPQPTCPGLTVFITFEQLWMNVNVNVPVCSTLEVPEISGDGGRGDPQIPLAWWKVSWLHFMR